MSDNTALNFACSEDAVMLHIRPDQDKNWSISYNNGKTFSKLTGSNEKPLSSDHIRGYIVKPNINAEGFHEVSLCLRTSSNIVETIPTGYKADTGIGIGAIVEDTELHRITITLTDGRSLLFEMDDTHPQGIIVLDKEVTIRQNHTAEIVFRLNPSDASLHINDLYLDRIDADGKASVSYISPPANLQIQDLNPSKDKNGNIREGEYVLTIKDKGIQEKYSERIALVISRSDLKGNTVNISSDVITVTSEYPSSLPRVYITTPEGAGISSKTEWVQDSRIRIVQEDGTEVLDASTSIRGRGNTTWGYPKKPYAIKLDSKAEVLGMPKHKRWVLLANWMDRTLIRNEVAFEMGRRVMEWAPRGEFIELYLNGKHLGNYLLCEHIKVDKNRVAVDELDEDTDFSDNSLLSGGYILEFDTYGPDDEINYFYTPVKKYPVTIKEPDEDVITSWQHPAYLYVYNHIAGIEQLLDSDFGTFARWSEVEEYLDIRSFIDWWIIYELTGNTEPNHPKSCYMYKKREGKLCAGPIWDFDWYTFVHDTKDPLITGSIWYGYLFGYEGFRSAVKERWAQTKEKYLDIVNYISEQAELVRMSDEVNFCLWPITMVVNGDEHLSFDEAIGRMRSRYSKRFEAIDSYISQL